MAEGTIVVGAGVAGLACARALARAGREVLVLDRARDVGGRCATRRCEGQPVDFGPLFLHGRDPAFLAEVEGAGGVPGWPRRIQGQGLPCQPDSLDPALPRFTFPSGVKAFPRHLATGLRVRLETEVTAVRPGPAGFRLAVAGGGDLECRDLVLALALEEDRRLLATLPEPGPAAGIRALLGLMGSVACLTVLAGYPLDGPEPPWDILYPEDSQVMQLLAQDSGKRPEPRFRTLVAQARPSWSRARLEEPEEAWTGALLEEMARLAGSWARRPLWVRSHRWRCARVEPTCELAGPVRLTGAGGQRLGLAGDLFAPGGGVQAAWLSGTRLAASLLREEP